MAGGRPTDYTPKMLKAAREYAETVKEAALKGDIQNTALPKVAELALILGVSRSTLYLWAQEHQEFSDTLDDISAAQEIRLLDNGLNGTYNPTIAKMVLSSNHNYKEKQDITTDDKPLSSLLVQFLDEKANTDADTKGV